MKILKPDGTLYECKDVELFELTRAGQNICLICGKPKEMYFIPWCPRCDKPWPKVVHVLNLIQALRHLETIGHEGIYDRLWRVIEEGDPFENDGCFFYWFPEEGELPEENMNDLKILRDVFKLPEKILIHVCW